MRGGDTRNKKGKYVNDTPIKDKHTKERKISERRIEHSGEKYPIQTLKSMEVTEEMKIKIKMKG